MTNVEALQALYIALGGDAADVGDCTTIVEVLNAISAKYEGADDATLNPDAIANITAVVDNIAPEPTLENKTVTPTTAEQTITAGEGYDGLGTVTVNAVTAAIDSNITAGNIKKNVEILGVTGSYGGSNQYNATIKDPSTLTDKTLYANMLSEINIPNGYTAIGAQAYQNYRSLKTVIIPNSITIISDLAFGGCTNLQTVTIGNGVTSISATAFSDCTSLETITINKVEGSISGAPWGATNATVVWTG